MPKILLFDLYGTLLEDVSLDFNLGLRSLWEEHYRDKCSFDDIKAYGEELFIHMQNLHRQGLEFPFVKEELHLYAEKYGGNVIDMSIDEEAEFLSRCNEVRVYDGLYEILDSFAKEGISMFVLSNSGFRGGALRKMLDSQGIDRFFEEVWSSADFGKVKPAAELFEMAVGEILGRYLDRTREDIIFIGDTYKTDIVGAHKAGLKAIWINRKNEPDTYGFADYQIMDVTELWRIYDNNKRINN